MKKLQRITLGLALLATVACGGIDASAKSVTRRALTGVIQSIDLRARTIELREQGTGRVITVRVPEGALLRTESTNQPLAQLERLMPGMSIRAVAVE
jgi:hypothetical protein